MMELYDKLGILVDKFMDDNSDFISKNAITKIILHSLAFNAGLMAIDHQLEIMRSMKKESAK